MTTTTKRAKIGGEFGANGEWYEGGKFINTIPENDKRSGSRPKGTRKQEIEPYKWVVEPTADARSIYKAIAGIYGKVDGNGVMVINANPVTLAYYRQTLEDVEALAARYNNGERWI